MQTIFESRYNGNAGTVSARHSVEEVVYEGNYAWRKWAHKFHRTSWDYSKDINDNHIEAVRMACRVQLQKDPVAIVWGGDSKQGRLWIVTVSD